MPEVACNCSKRFDDDFYSSRKRLRSWSSLKHMWAAWRPDLTVGLMTSNQKQVRLQHETGTIACTRPAMLVHVITSLARLGMAKPVVPGLLPVASMLQSTWNMDAIVRVASFPPGTQLRCARRRTCCTLACRPPAHPAPSSRNTPAARQQHRPGCSHIVPHDEFNATLHTMIVVSELKALIERASCI